MKITYKWLREQWACPGIYRGFINQENIEDGIDLYSMLDYFKKEDWSSANWLIPRFMNKSQYLEYATISVKRILPIYEEESLIRKKLYKTIDISNKIINRNSSSNRKIAYNIFKCYNVDSSYSMLGINPLGMVIGRELSYTAYLNDDFKARFCACETVGQCVALFYTKYFNDININTDEFAIKLIDEGINILKNG